MFKKRNLSIIALIVFAFTVGSIVAIRIEQSKIYEACRSAIVPVENQESWKYQRTRFVPFPVAVIFENGTNTVSCNVQRNSSVWQVTDIKTTSELPRIREICSKAMQSVEGYEPWKYQSTRFLPNPVVTFYDGTNAAWCEVQRKGSGWKITYLGTTLIGRLP